MQLQFIASLLTLSSTIASAYPYEHQYEARSVLPDVHGQLLYSRSAEPEDFEFDLTKRDLEYRDAEPKDYAFSLSERGFVIRDPYKTDDTTYRTALLVRDLGDLYIRDYESGTLYGRSLHLPRASEFILTKRVRGKPSPGKPSTGKPSSGKPGSSTGGGSEGASGYPELPEGEEFDGKRLYAWRRIYTKLHTFTRPGGVDHSELDKVTYDIEGQHHALVVGNGKEFKQYDLLLERDDWVKTHPNGNGAACQAYNEKFVPGEDSKMGPNKLLYLGRLGERTNFGSVTTKANQLAPAGSEYNVENNNCKTFVDALYEARKG